MDVDNDEDFVYVYTDGASSSKYDRNGARIGLGVCWGDGHSLNVSDAADPLVKPVYVRVTNNCGEIQAATRLIKQAQKNGVHSLSIDTDSQFLINSATKWMPGWKEHGWKMSSGEQVKNAKDFIALDRAQRSVVVNWNYVKAYQHDFSNEMEERLPKLAAGAYNK